MASWIFRTKEDQKARKSPKIAHFCSALPCKVIREAAQCRHAYSCNKIRCNPSSIISLQISVFCVLWLGWCTWSLSFFNRHTGLSWRLHGQKRRIYTSRLRLALFFDYAYQLLNFVVTALYISFFFSVSNFLLSLIFLWVRISEATHKEISRYSKSEAR